MFSLFSGRRTANCESLSRRELLSIGTLGLGGLSLSTLLQAQASAATKSYLRDKSVLFLNLQGGPTHIETFDPKMTAPREYRAMFGETQTSLPGVTFGSHFEKLARWADRMAIVRSFRHGVGSHATAAKLVAAGGNPTGGNMGSVFARLAGSNSPKTGMPWNSVVTPPAVGDKYKSLGQAVERVTDLGSLPSSVKPFDPSAGGDVVQNMELRLSEDRLGDRRALLANLDAFKRETDRSQRLAGADEFQQQAFDVILGGIGDAFDLSKEAPKLVARYDTNHIDIPDALYKKKNKNLLRQSPIALGRQMLMARRLLEADCRFVTVTSAGWDMHGNAFGVDDGMPILGTAVDHALSALLEDLEDRGMLDDVLVVISGEFGRTPRINKKGGRDHWGNLCTLAFAGGGIQAGQVIGRSDRTASQPATEPVTLSNLFASVMGTLFNLGELRLQSGVPSDINRALGDALPIPGLV